jgi:hypothetical protein
MVSLAQYLTQYPNTEDAVLAYPLSGKSLDPAKSVANFGQQSLKLPNVNLPDTNLQGPNLNLPSNNLGNMNLPQTPNVNLPPITLPNGQPLQSPNLPNMNLNLPQVNLPQPTMPNISLPFNLPDIGKTAFEGLTNINLPSLQIPVDTPLGQLNYQWTDPLKSTLEPLANLAPWKAVYDIGSQIVNKLMQGNGPTEQERTTQFRNTGSDFIANQYNATQQVSDYYNQLLKSNPNLLYGAFADKALLQGGTNAKNTFLQKYAPELYGTWEGVDMLSKLNDVVNFGNRTSDEMFSIVPNYQVGSNKVFSKEEQDYIKTLQNEMNNMYDQMSKQALANQLGKVG